jgi:hypothetical protein
MIIGGPLGQNVKILESWLHEIIRTKDSWKSGDKA